MVSLSRCRNHLLVGIPHCCMFGALWSDMVCLYVCKTMVLPSRCRNHLLVGIPHSLKLLKSMPLRKKTFKVRSNKCHYQHAFRNSYFIQKHSQGCRSLFGNNETRLVWKFCKFSLKLVVQWLSQRLDAGCGDTWQLLSLRSHFTQMQIYTNGRYRLTIVIFHLWSPFPLIRFTPVQCIDELISCIQTQDSWG